MNTELIIKFLDQYMIRNYMQTIGAVEANALLAKKGLLGDSSDRPGKPLRDLLRKGRLKHAFQKNGSGSEWVIPISSGKSNKSNGNLKNDTITVKSQLKNEQEVKKTLEDARKKYKPSVIKYLLIAEAPPDSLERFFYYEDVKKHDDLFLGVAQALYPKLKDRYISSGRLKNIKEEILSNLKKDGFYLIDLSELPISMFKESLALQVPGLLERIKPVIEKDTKIIIIKVNVYDHAYSAIANKFPENIINQRIPFPGQGGQKKFQEVFKNALVQAGYY